MRSPRILIMPDDSEPPPRQAAPVGPPEPPPRAAMRPGGRPWRDAESARLAEMLAAGASWRQCAAALGRSYQSVRMRGCNLGLGSAAMPPTSQLPVPPRRPGWLARFRAAWRALRG